MSKAEEAERVDGWKVERFLRQGFDLGQIDLLILWGVSPGNIDSLVDSECPLPTIMRIVAPLEPPARVPLLDHAEQYSVKV